MFDGAFQDGGFEALERQEERQAAEMLELAEFKLETADAKPEEDAVSDATTNPWGSFQMPGLGEGVPDYARWRSAFPFLSIGPSRSWPAQENSDFIRAAGAAEDPYADDEELEFQQGEDNIEDRDDWEVPASQGIDEDALLGEDTEMRLLQGSENNLIVTGVKMPTHAVENSPVESAEDILASEGVVEEVLYLDAPVFETAKEDGPFDRGRTEESHEDTPQEQAIEELLDILAKSVIDAIREDLEVFSRSVAE